MTEPTTRPPAPLAFVDTETDGLHPKRKAWEIAIVRREPNGRETAWQAFVDIDLRTADPFGLKVGRFYDRHPMGRQLSGLDEAPTEWLIDRGSVSPGGAASKVAQLTHGAHIIGSVPSFDMHTLDRLLRDWGLVPGWHYTPHCIKTLALGYLRGRGVKVDPSTSSEDLTAALGLDPTPEDERHTAMGDVRWTMRVYDAVMSGDALHWAVEHAAEVTS